jgi:hypothetical protein
MLMSRRPTLVGRQDFRLFLGLRDRGRKRRRDDGKISVHI